MDFTNKYVIKWLGTNLEKGKKNYNDELQRARTDFKNKYPLADISKFDFWVSINNQGEVDEPTKIVYTSGKESKLYNETGTTWKYSWNTNSLTFNNKYRSKLFWGPADGIFQPTEKLVSFSLGNGRLGFSFQQFPVYVNDHLSFTSNFQALDTKWEGKEDDITKATFDHKNDNYFASLCAAYVIFAKTGICSKHLETRDDVLSTITSIMRFYVYYHMKHFLKRPRLMTPFLSSSDLRTIQKSIPTKKIWTSKSKHTKQTISSFLPEKQSSGKRSKRGQVLRW